MPLHARPNRIAAITSPLRMLPLNHYSAAMCGRRQRQRGLLRRPRLLDKPLNALHNPVTLHVVCQLMLLRSLYGGRERYLNAHVSQGGWPVLVLNADFRPLSYYPLSLWSWQDAIKAGVLDRVNILEHYDRAVRSPSFENQLAHVVLLKSFVKPTTHPAFTRFNVFLRDRFVF